MSENPYVFPQDIYDDATSTKVRREGGMTLRDYFAAKALASMIAAGLSGIEARSIEAYGWADAMLAEREKKR